MSKDNNLLIAVHEHLKKEFEVREESEDYPSIRVYLGIGVSRIDFVRNDSEVIMSVHFRSNGVVMDSLDFYEFNEEFLYCDPNFLDNICEFARANIDTEY